MSRRLFIGAGAVAACGVGAWALPQFTTERGQWATRRGERAEFDLSDGSRVVVGGNSVLEQAFTRRRRNLSLLRGQMFIDVRADHARPLLVTVADCVITALGTAFDVRLQNATDLVVTLMHGRVRVQRTSGADLVTLDAGQQLLYEQDVQVVRDVDADAALAWRRGILDFDDVSLAEAVADFNQNAAHAILVDDPRLVQLRVSGVFSATDVEGFARALEAAYPVRAQVHRSGDVALEYAP